MKGLIDSRLVRSLCTIDRFETKIEFPLGMGAVTFRAFHFGDFYRNILEQHFQACIYYISCLFVLYRLHHMYSVVDNLFVLSPLTAHPTSKV